MFRIRAWQRFSWHGRLPWSAKGPNREDYLFAPSDLLPGDSVL
jgi:hypothetical protein